MQWYFMMSHWYLSHAELVLTSKLSAVMETLHICAVQYDSHTLHVAIKHLNVTRVTEDLIF